MIGRIVWSSTSDIIGRKNIYRVYLGVGALLYLLITLLGNANQTLFLIASMLILSFYGAGFATVPAYLRDLFGTYQVGAIHGRLLTAWSTAGVLGPVIVNAIADAQIAAGVQGPGRYTVAFSIMIGLLVDRLHLQRAHPAGARALPRAGGGTGDEGDGSEGGMSTQSETTDTRPARPPIAWLAWVWVIVPFLYGLYQLVDQDPGAVRRLTPRAVRVAPWLRAAMRVPCPSGSRRWCGSWASKAHSRAAASSTWSST